ncbi:hypothetical protein ABC733_02030 [Mangrovibacter sp. SLW1]
MAAAAGFFVKDIKEKTGKPKMRDGGLINVMKGTDSFSVSTVGCT